MALIGLVPSGVEERKISVNQDYVEAVLRAGGIPVLFPAISDTDRLFTLLDRVDGLLLTGGPDIDPSEYGEATLPCCGEISARRDAMELPLCREAIRRRMPLLAICRGLQVLCVALGGTLYQDLSEQLGTEVLHPVYHTPADPVHDVEVAPGTLLSTIVGAGTLGVNSRHHQGIKTIENNLRVCATSADGLIEGIEMPDLPFVLGIQWHPESLSDRYPAHQRIFDAFVTACSR